MKKLRQSTLKKGRKKDIAFSIPRVTRVAFVIKAQEKI